MFRYNLNKKQGNFLKYLIIFGFLLSIASASILDLNSFEANFKQIVTDDKGKQLIYKGTLKALQPQFAFWKYIQPITKNIYLTSHIITIIEPEIEQVIIKSIPASFDFFKMIQNAKKISKNKYTTHINDMLYTITIEKEKIKSIMYHDEFDNKVEIIFDKQFTDRNISKEIFYPLIPKEYDIVRE